MSKKTKTIYLDHAATTPVDPEVFKAMQPFFSKYFGNPSALYKEGLITNGALNDSRRAIAQILHALPDNIIFTSGGTESDNLAIFGVTSPPLKEGTGGVVSPTLTRPRPTLPLKREETKTGHIITSPIEHHAVLYPIEQLKKEGWDITYVPVDKNGLVNATNVIKAIKPNTVLISIMYANNEIGAIEPIAEIGRQLLRYRKEKGTLYPYFHTDACQAAGYLDLDVEKLHVDLMTLNGSKIYGPKGIGLLYVRRDTKLSPVQHGGSQERGLRAGTENIPGIVGLAKALEITEKLRNPDFAVAQNRGSTIPANRNRDKKISKLDRLSSYFYNKLKKEIPSVRLNGAELGENRLPNNINICLPGLEGEALLIYLDSRGIMCSTGSACTATTSEPSHVLRAIGLSEEDIRSSLRFTLGKSTTKADIDYTVKNLKEIISKLKF